MIKKLEKTIMSKKGSYKLFATEFTNSLQTFKTFLLFLRLIFTDYSPTCFCHKVIQVHPSLHCSDVKVTAIS